MIPRTPLIGKRVKVGHNSEKDELVKCCYAKGKRGTLEDVAKQTVT